MGENVTVIDIVAQVTDDTASGAKSAQDNLSKLEKSMLKTQKQLQKLKGKSKLEMVATLKDMASKGIQSVAAAGKKLGGKVWTVTLKAVDLVTAPFKKIGGLISSPIAQAAAFAGVSLGIADTVNTFKGFEQVMANVKAIAGSVSDEELPGIMQAAKDIGVSFQEGANATETSMNILTATAKHLGETTEFSAAQASEAMENLSMAGWKSKDIVSGMPGLLDLASAGSVDLATAADVTSSALAQFSLDAGEANRVADVLAATATNSKTNVAGLGESLKYAGTVAGQLGYSIEDTALAIGLMGNASIDGTMAGTALKTGLMRLAKQEDMTAEETNAMAEAADRLHISMKNDDGTMKSLKTLLDDMRKGFAGVTNETERMALANALFGQEASVGMLALMDTTEAGTKKYNDLYTAIENCDGVAGEMADIKMDTLQGSLLYLQSAAEGVKIAIGEKLKPYIKGLVDWVTAHMPDIQSAVGSAVDFVTGKIDSVKDSVQSLTSSAEWQKAETLWDKIGLAWDKLIAEPFDTWWNGKGKAWLTEKAGSIGEGLGGALKTGLLGLLGIDAGGVLTEGASIGKSFFDGFMQGFDWGKVASALGKALWDGLKSLLSDAATLLPGGEAASGTSLFSTAALGYGAYKTAKAGYGLYKGGKAVLGTVKALGDATGASEILKGGLSFGGGLAKSAGQFLLKHAAPIAGAAAALKMGTDAYAGTQKSKEWTGSDSTGAKIASGWAAALGGTGSGLFGDESLGKKAADIGGGALKGAGIGAAIGSIVPGVGNVIGAAVGAGIGALGAAVGGENIAKAVYGASNAIVGFFTETVPNKVQEFWDNVTGYFSNTVMPAVEAVGSAIHTFFTETVPSKAKEIWDGVLDFFTKAIPNAVQSIGEGITGFFNGIKQKISGLWEQVTGFFSADSGGISKTRSGKTIPKHAEGGIMTSPHMGLVAEDGAEAIIPLSGKRRGRGIDLWEKAGQMLGVRPYAEGGIAGIQSGQEAPKSSSGAVVPISGGGETSATAGGGITVSVGAPNFEIHVDGSAQDPQVLAAAIRENVLGLTDDIAYAIAAKLIQTFANTPKAAWG